MDWLMRPAAALGRAVAAGEIDARDLTDAYLAAIAAHPARENIYARTTPARARAEAAAAADRARRGMTASPLDGVPLSWKDLIDTAGTATEGGSRLLAGRVPARDAEVLRRATAAGTVCLGKTHTTELAFTGLGPNPMTATPPNAIRPELAPGGSSSGAAVSTKLGLAAAGIGTDTGGSVRIPAGWNDLVGLKTTAGLVPLDGVLPLAPSLDSVGPLCRTVEDAAQLFAILAARPAPDLSGAAPGDEPLCLTETVMLDGCDDGIVAGVEAALDRLGAAGARITRRPVPELADAMTVLHASGGLVVSEAWAEWGALIEANPGVAHEEVESGIRRGRNADGARDAATRRAFARLSAALQERMAEHGLIVMPTTACWPPDRQRLLDDPLFRLEREILTLRNTRLANFLGLCSLTVPTGTPMCGLMLYAPPNAEARLLRAGAAIEAALAG